MKLHPFQIELVSGLRAVYASGIHRALLQLGTGGGKTATASDLLRMTVARGRRAIFLAHLDSLIEDTHARLTSAGVPAGFIQAGRPSDPTATVQVCSLATLHRRGEHPPAELVILDECHRAMAATVRPILEAYPSAHVLGLTATPQRGDGQPLGDVFERMVSGPSNRWLTDRGYLVPADVLAPADYADEGLVLDPVAAYQRHTPGQRAIVFASTVAHAEDLAARFVLAGIAAEVITGETSREDRARIRDAVTSGAVRVLVNVNVAIEGFDLPALEVVILARAFTVTGAFLQAIGRGLRPSKVTGKTRCTVIDLRGAVNLHGLPDEDRAWSLDGTAVRRLETMTALRRCKECLAVFRPEAVCPRCGARAESVERVPRVLSRAERLVRISALPQAERDAKYLATLHRIARVRIRMPEHRAAEWALTKFKAKFGREPARRAA
jgi:superfamily II DNA or RNA helicase